MTTRTCRTLLGLALGWALVLHAAAREIVVNTAQITPFSYESDNGPAGMAVEILQAAGKAAGLEFRFSFLPWKRAQLETLASGDHAIVPLTRTTERERDYLWIAPLFEYSFVIVTRIGRAAPATLEEAKRMSIGVLGGNPMHAALPAMGFRNLKPGNSEEMLAKQLKSNLVDAWVVAEPVAHDTWRRIGGKPEEIRIGPKIGAPMQVYFAASPRFPAADAKLIADEVNRLRASGELARILERYR